jgi:hypothetical protein
MAVTSNTDIIDRLQLKYLRMSVAEFCYVPDTVVRRDPQILPTFKEEIRHYRSQYSARLSVHPNDLVMNFIAQPDNRRLRRHNPNDVATRLLMQLSYLQS